MDTNNCWGGKPARYWRPIQGGRNMSCQKKEKKNRNHHQIRWANSAKDDFTFSLNANYVFFLNIAIVVTEI